MATLLSTQTIVLALIAGLVASCSSEQVASGPNVVARWKACGNTKDGLRNRGRTILQDHAWVDRTLVVNVVDNDSCAGTRIADPSYQVNGKLVELKWGWLYIPAQPRAACYCDFKVRFEVTGLAPGDYQVQLGRVR